MVMDLERLIDEARSSGTLDSSGRFTLDLDRAWEKLGQFASPEIGAFVLYLVRAAVGSGASSVRFREGWGQLTLEIPGEVPEPEKLFDHPLNANAPRWLQELALGIFLALSSGVALQAVLESGGQRMEVRLQGARPMLTLSGADVTGKTRLTLRCRLLWSFLGVDSLVRRRCRFAPVPVLWNVGLVVSPPPLEELTAWRHVVTDLELPGLGFPHVSGGAFQPWETELPLEGVVGFGKGTSTLTVVVNGVAQERRWEGSFPGARVWAANPTLRLDLSGNVALDQPVVDELHQAILELALNIESEKLTPDQIVDLVMRGVGGEPAGRWALTRWSSSHEARPALTGAMMMSALRRHDFAEAEDMRAQLWGHVSRPPSFLRRLRVHKPPSIDLAELGTILEDVAVQHPAEALEWVTRTRDLTFRLRQSLKTPGLVDLALRFQRFETAEKLALHSLGVPGSWDSRTNVSWSRGYAVQEVMGGKRYAEALLLLRCLSPHSHMRMDEWLLANGPPELRLASLVAVADGYRWAAARYNDRALCNVASFRWRGQYLKRADELYVEALSLGGDPVKLGRARAATAAIPIEGLAKTAVLQPKWQGARDRHVGLFLLRLTDDALLEAEVLSELGDLTRASVLLDGCDGLVAEVDRMILERLAGREVSLVDLKLEELVILPARRRTTWEDFPALLQASQDMAPVHERLAARLIRLGELCDRSRRLVLFRTALAVQLRWLGFLDLSRPPSAVLRLKEF